MVLRILRSSKMLVCKAGMMEHQEETDDEFETGLKHGFNKDSRYSIAEYLQGPSTISHKVSPRVIWFFPTYHQTKLQSTGPRLTRAFILKFSE